MDARRVDTANLTLIAIAAAFFALGAVRLHLPPFPGFDEGYYLAAGIELTRGAVTNREHPMLAKELLALAWLSSDDKAVLVRLWPLLLSSAGLYFAADALRRHTASAFTGIAYALLLASGFLLMGLARLTLLEPFVFFFAALAFWCQARGLPVAAAAAIGLACACKWTAVPLAAALFAIPLARRDWREAARFALVSAGAYLLTFVPGFLVPRNPLRPSELIYLHLAMVHRLGLFVRSHPYASQWWEWIYGGGHAYVAWGTYAGAQRAALLVANPLTALPALLATFRFRDRFVSLTALGVLALFPLSGKPVLIIHQFVLPHALMLAALAIWLGHAARWLRAGMLAASLAAFAVYYPAITSGRDAVTWPWRPHAIDLRVAAARRQAALDADACLEHPAACYAPRWARPSAP